VLKCAVLLALVAAAVPAASSAAKTPFDAHALVKASGCVTAIADTSVTRTGCAGTAHFGGTSSGTVELTYGAKVDLTTNKGSQQGTLTFHGPTGKDVLVVSFKGAVTVGAGASTGTWTATKRSGTFAKLAPSKGTFTSHSPDQGATVSFDVRG
jgi:hypothetical protein